MRFKLLLEKLPKIPRDATIKFNKADPQTRKEIIMRVLKAYNKPMLLKPDVIKGVYKSTYASAEQYGLDPSINDWLPFLDSVKENFNEATAEVLPIIFDIHKREGIDILKPWLLNGLAHINFTKTNKKEEINYIIKLLDVLYDDNKVRKFFTDPEQLDYNELFENNDPSGYYKPAGIGRHNDPDTLFGLIEIWSEGNEKSAEGKQLTLHDLRTIKDKYKNEMRDDIEKSLGGPHKIEDDTVIYAENIKHNSNPKDTEKLSDPSFWIWDANKKQWDKYITPNSKKVLAEIK